MLAIVVLFIAAVFAAPVGAEPVAVSLGQDEPLEQEDSQQVEEPESEGEAARRANLLQAVKPEVYWDQGLRFNVDKPRIRARFGVRFQFDAAWFGQDNEVETIVGDLEDGAIVRRSRIYVEGDLIDRLEFKLQFNLAGNRDGAVLRDFFVGIRDLPVRVRVGHMREPFGLDNSTGAWNLTFMERAVAMAQGAQFSTGVLVANDSASIFHLNDEVRRLTFQLGVFQSAGELGFVDGSSLVGSGRLTALPYVKTDNGDLVHVGVSARVRSMNDDDVQDIRQRPESNLSNFFLDAGSIRAERILSGGLEAAARFGRFAAQGELLGNRIDLRDDPRQESFSMWGWYAQASWFLTDDSRNYRYSNGTWGPVFPSAPIGDGGAGAWEIAARVAHIDFDDQEIRGGRLTDLTLALNWYASSRSRLSANFVSAGLRGVGSVPIFQVRLQFDI
jgi:phosphate-selective porin OprO/OprP